MALKIYWTPQAEKGYDEIINYLAVKWTDREIHHFIEEIMHFLNLLSENPYLLQSTSTRKNVYRGPVNPLTIVTYRIRPQKKLLNC
ncbi:MAG: type II toxin-antitoxin system RelE/ParE family toxin [Candidatus Saccharibacteria bacterium]